MHNVHRSLAGPLIECSAKTSAAEACGAQSTKRGDGGAMHYVSTRTLLCQHDWDKTMLCTLKRIQLQDNKCMNLCPSQEP
jgi:hypothetical protein